MIRLSPFKRSLLLSTLILAGLAACTNAPSGEALKTNDSATALKPHTSEEKLADFEVLVRTVKELYGPLEYKEKRFGYKIDDLASEYRAQLEATASDAEAFGIYAKFLTRLQDGHVSIRAKLASDASYEIPVTVAPVEGKAIVVKLGEETLAASHGISVGDEILEVDGKPVFDYLPIIRQYDTIGNDISDQHLISQVFQRAVHMKELKPTAPHARVKLSKAGKVFERNLIWSQKPGAHKTNQIVPPTTFNVMTTAYADKASSLESAGFMQIGSEKPFFVNAVTEKIFKRRKPSEEYLKKHGLTDVTKAPDMHAYTYTFEGKRILLLRLATYSIADQKERIAWIKALMEEYGDMADVLVLDQTHNPGGLLTYAASVVSLFADSDTRGLVNFLNADRRWLSSLSDTAEKLSAVPGGTEYKKVYDLGYKLVEEAYDKGLGITERPVPIALAFDHIQPDSVGWDKPILLLVDELAGSCGDIVPMLMKENKLATLFGQRTMGLGGNVEMVMQLPYSQAEVRLTRGLFTTFSPEGKYDIANLVENNGVQPDIVYPVKASDVASGYMQYVVAFSKAAVEAKKLK